MTVEITQIRRLKRGLFSVYADGEQAGVVDSATLSESRLEQGLVVDWERLSEIFKKSAQRLAERKAMKLLEYGDNSKAGLKTKLMRYTDAESAEKAVEKMEGLGFVNDADYAERLAGELINTKLYSRSRAVSEMVSKGIERRLAEDSAENVRADAEEQIIKLLARKFPRGVCDETSRRRASSLLSRYGYRWEDIKNALE